MISFRGLIAVKSIPEVIRFCLDIECNIKDGGILPNNLCQNCLEKVKLFTKFKTGFY